MPSGPTSGGAPGFSSLADMVRFYESGGDYNAKNPGTTASGAYQFIDSTWRGYASQIGIDTSVYPTARSAPPYLQDRVFQRAVATNGLNDWTCPGCNPALTSYVNNNPGVSALPVAPVGSGLSPGGLTDTGVSDVGHVNAGLYDIFDQNGQWVGQTTDPSLVGPGETARPASGTASPAGGGGPGGGQGGNTSNVDPNSGLPLDSATAAMPGMILEEPATVGLSPGLAQATSGWIKGAETAVGNAFTKALNAAEAAIGALFQNVTNYFIRAGLILLAVIIIALALWRMMDPGGKNTMAIIKTAAKAA